MALPATHICFLPSRLALLTPTPLPHQKTKLQFYVLKTNQWFISRLMVHVLKVSKIVIMFTLTMYLIQTQTRGSMHEAGEYGYGSEWVSASVDQRGSSEKRMR